MKSRIWRLIAAGVLLAGIGLVGAQQVLSAGAPSIPAGFDRISAEAGTTAGAAVTEDDVTAMQAAIEGSRFSWWAKGRGAIGTDTRSTTADVYAVTGAFQDFHHMDMLFGSFVPRSGSGRAVVLDDALAYRLFGTTDAVGLEVKFNGLTFQVCGVCKADTSLLGLMSGSGQFRAYVSGQDLVSTGRLAIGGFEAFMPNGAPGESLQKTEDAMQGQGVSASSFLLTDESEQWRLKKETSRLPMAALAVSSALVLLAFVLRSAHAFYRECAAILRGDYFSRAFGSLALRLGKFLLVLAAAAGLSWILWSAAGLELYLPAKYIPGSWIDLTFYKDLIASESQQAMSASAYPPQWWDWRASASAQLSAGLNTLALFGCVTAALSLRALRSDRRLAPRGASRAAWDAPILWGLALLSMLAALLLAVAMGLPLSSSPDAPAVLALSLGVWALATNRDGIEAFLYKTPPAADGGTPLE